MPPEDVGPTTNELLQGGLVVAQIFRVEMLHL